MLFSQLLDLPSDPFQGFPYPHFLCLPFELQDQKPKSHLEVSTPALFLEIPYLNLVPEIGFPEVFMIFPQSLQTSVGL
jgi:hypothetical protein